MSEELDAFEVREHAGRMIREYFTAFGAERGTHGAIGEVVALLGRADAEPTSMDSIFAKHGLSKEPWFLPQCADLLVGFATFQLEMSAYPKATVVASIRLLRRLLRIADGTLSSLRPGEVATLVRAELEDALADAWLSNQELLSQAELQAALGIGYDDFLAFARIVFENAWTDLLEQERQASGDAAEIVRLKKNALEPMVKLATSRPRTLGAIFS
jgi:hypothetical protein